MSNTQEYLDGWEAWPDDNFMNNPQVESEGSSSSVEAAHESGAWVELESETSSYAHSPYRNSGLHNNYRPTTPAQQIGPMSGTTQPELLPPPTQPFAEKSYHTNDGFPASAPSEPIYNTYQQPGPAGVPNDREPTEASLPDVQQSSQMINGHGYKLPNVGHQDSFGPTTHQQFDPPGFLNFRAPSGPSQPEQLQPTQMINGDAFNMSGVIPQATCEPVATSQQQLPPVKLDCRAPVEASQSIHDDAYNLPIVEHQTAHEPTFHQQFSPPVEPGNRASFEASQPQSFNGDGYNLPSVGHLGAEQPTATAQQQFVPPVVPDRRASFEASMPEVWQPSPVIQGDGFNQPTMGHQGTQEPTVKPHQQFDPPVVSDYMASFEGTKPEVQQSSPMIPGDGSSLPTVGHQGLQEPTAGPHQQFDSPVVSNYRASFEASVSEAPQSSPVIHRDGFDLPTEGRQGVHPPASAHHQQFGPPFVPDQRTCSEASLPEVQQSSQIVYGGQPSVANQTATEPATLFSTDYKATKSDNFFGSEEMMANSTWASLNKETIPPPQTGLLATGTVEASASQKTPIIPKTGAESVSVLFTPQPEDAPAPSTPKTELSLSVTSSELVQQSSMIGAVVRNPPVFYRTQPVLETNKVPVQKREDTSDGNHFLYQDEPSDSSSTSLHQAPSTSSEPLEVKELRKPDSPCDERQVAFLQKQLAGKAPTSSPHTSLWMNANTMLPSPCVLAPAANLPSTAAAERRGSGQAIPSVKQNEQPDRKEMLPVVPIDATKSRLNECARPETPDQSNLKTDATAYSLEIFTPNECARPETPDQSNLKTDATAYSLEIFTPTPVENRFDAMTAKLPPATVKTQQPPLDVRSEQGNNGQQDSGSVMAGSMIIPNQTLPSTTQEPAVSNANDIHQTMNVVLNPGNGKQQFTGPLNKKIEHSNSDGNNTAHRLMVERPFHDATAKQNISEIPPPSNVQGISQVTQSPPVGPVAVQQLDNSSLSLASLLQGGNKHVKQRPSQPSAQVTSQMSSNVNPYPASNPPNLSNSTNLSNPLNSSIASSLPSVPVSNVDQTQDLSGHTSHESQLASENQSFDSFERTETPDYSSDRDHGKTEGMDHSRDRHYGERHNHPRDADHSHYLDRRDSCYSDDERNSYDGQSRRDPYYEQERDLDRRHYGRRDYDRKRGYDHREDNYYRDHDRGMYDDRGHSRRDSFGSQDSRYGYGYSSRQGRGGYDDRRSSREDLYRASFHSAYNTSPPGRHSPSAYDYSVYGAHQYGYPAYGDQQSVDMYQYQYLMYLYQFHPQHYEQYCAQLGYFNMGYSPEQMAQYYGGMYNTSGYDVPQEPVEETTSAQPERFTPLLYRTQHPIVKFSGGRLISILGGNDTETPKCTIAAVQMAFSAEEVEGIKIFPGPLSSRYSSRTEVITFCEKRITGIELSGDGIVRSLVWKVLASLVKHNGAFVASELAEIIMENWRSCNNTAEHEFLSPDSTSQADGETHKHIQLYREMLLVGATKDAMEHCMHNGLWGHAMVLASKMDKKFTNDVTTRFMKTMTDFDPIRTVYDHLSGHQPVALLTTDDWQRNLAAMVANPPRQHPKCVKKNMTCLGDTLLADKKVWEAHLCFLLAGEQFGFPSLEKTKMGMIGIDHKTTPITGRYLPLENLQMMEVYEYAISLSNEEHHIPVMQSYKCIHLNKLSESGFKEEALQYAEVVGQTVIKHPTSVNSVVVKNVREAIDRLNPRTEDAAEMIEMLDKVLEIQNSPSQTSGSVTESESEVEEPLAESSASYFSGYEHLSNLPKHQPEVAEDVKPQSSFAEPVVNSAPAQQETMTTDIRQESLTERTVASRESWSEEMEDQAAQLDFKSAMPTHAPVPPPQAPLPPSQTPQHLPLAPIPPPQPTFFSPGPPFKQVESQQAERVEEQYANQWTGGARFDDLQKAEPILPKEPEPTKKTEEKPVKKNEPKRGSPIGGWLSGLLSKVMLRGPNEMILPDDSKKTIYYDENLKRWVNTEEDEQDKTPPPPPPSDLQLGGGRPPMMSAGNATSAGATTQGLNGPVSTPFSPPAAAAPGFPGSVDNRQTPVAVPAPPSKFSRKAFGGGRLGKKYVDVLNPSGQSSSGSAMLPSSFLPTFPGPVTEFNPAQMFVPAPVPVDNTNDTFSSAEPVVANPGSRPSTPLEDGSDQHSQHSRSSSVSLTSAEVRSYMMQQVPEPPPQNMAPVFYDPAAFSQPRGLGTPRKSRYPGPARK
ncbi:protein transport protein Sec16A-like isoform X7 [Acropora millepora]|nr:protein transport protein Sec16A-like isoform X7 [Acropora millepora]XP_029196227.2 protein transport protein Sec16A-like isoform X7 [Acropora millepora]